MRNPYLTNFRGCCVITLIVVCHKAPYSALISCHWHAPFTRTCYTHIHYWQCHVSHSSQALLALRAEIMGNVSLSIPTISLTWFWAFDDPCSGLVYLRKNQLPRSTSLPSLIIHSAEGPYRIISPSLKCFTITYHSLGWGATSHNFSIAYLPNSTNIIIIFRCR